VHNRFTKHCIAAGEHFPRFPDGIEALSAASSVIQEPFRREQWPSLWSNNIIKGNDYRLIVAINYHFRIVLILWLGTHKEYDKIDTQKVAHEKERYADSSNSN
jgi:hypothetical protein